MTHAGTGAVANAQVAITDSSSVATIPPSSSSIPAFDSQANLFALQKHVAAAAKGLVAASTTTVTSTGSVSGFPANGQLDVASAHQRAVLQALSLSSEMSAVAPQPPATPNGAAPAIEANMTPGSPGSQDESSIITDGRRGPRRELSTSKRAAQNRAAQRAFRQRKEGYIKKLEEQVRELAEMENQFKNLQSENFTLREYVIHLQSKIIDLKAEMPQPPANLNLGSVGLGHNLSGASAAAAAASLLSNAANAAALQRQQEQEHAAAAAAAVAASGYAPAYVPVQADGTAADPKNEASLARVAQAVAQFETGTVDAVAAAAAAAAAAAGAEKDNVDADADADADAPADDDDASDPMDTTPEGAVDSNAKTE